MNNLVDGAKLYKSAFNKKNKYKTCKTTKEKSNLKKIIIGKIM